jgi:hypothetical protein
MSGAQRQPPSRGPAPGASALQSRDNFDVIAVTQWAGMNNQAAQTAIGDQEAWWIENMVPLGDGNLRSLYGKGPTLGSAPSGHTIVSLAGWASFAGGGTGHVLAFTSDGGGFDVNLTSGTLTRWAAGTFWAAGSYSPYALPIPVVQWGASGVAILAPLGMFAWDGTTLTSPGANAPTWLTGGATTALFAPASPPWKVKSGEPYQGRLWYVTDTTTGSDYGWSSPGNGADLSGSAGSGTATPTDPFLVSSVKSVVQSGTFLFVMGDNSINAISSVNTSGSPATTTFTYANVDPEVGQLITQQPVRLGRAMVMFSAAGIYTLYGGAAQISSDKIQTLFENINTSALPPNMGLAVFHGTKCIVCLVNVTDVFGTTRNIMLCWTGQKWFTASQEVSLTLITTSQIGSDSSVYGTDGSNLFKLFAVPSTTLTKRLTTKAYTGPSSLVNKAFTRVFMQADDIAGTGVSFTASVQSDRGSQTVTLAGATSMLTWTNSTGASISWTNSASDAIVWQRPNLGISGTAIQTWGQYMAVDMQSTAEDFSLQQVAIGYRNRVLLGA